MKGMLFGYICYCNIDPSGSRKKTIRQRRIKSLLRRIFHGTSNRRPMNVHENEDIPGEEEKYNPPSPPPPVSNSGKSRKMFWHTRST